MSDAVDSTPEGATRVFFGSLAFILLMVGIEAIVEKERFGSGFGLVLLGAAFSYAAVFWASARKILSVEAQAVIGRFAQSRATWFGMLFLVFQAVLLSQFVQDHRWPFSYPADPSVFTERDNLRQATDRAKGELSAEKEKADKWRFISILRQYRAAQCAYQFVTPPQTVRLLPFWRELFAAGGWFERQSVVDAGVSAGLTLRIRGETSPCASILQRALTDIYPNPPSKIAANQQTGFLAACNDFCVQIDLSY